MPVLYKQKIITGFTNERPNIVGAHKSEDTQLDDEAKDSFHQST